MMGMYSDRAEHRKVRILKPLEGVFTKYQPVVGRVYDALYNLRYPDKQQCLRAHICIIDVKDKKICLKRDEYELVEDDDESN